MKDSINTMSDLKVRIKELEALEARQVAGLKLQVHDTIEGMRPANLLKSAFNDMVGSKSLKQNAITASVGIGAGMLIKKIIMHKSKSLLGKMAGYGLQFLTTKLISKKLPALKQKIANL